jgi:hypothetical protein
VIVGPRQHARDRAPLQLLVELGRLAGLLEMGETRMDLLEQVRLDHGPDRALLAVVAGACRRSHQKTGYEECGGAQRCHRIGLPTPRMRLAQIHPIAA